MGTPAQLPYIMGRHLGLLGAEEYWHGVGLVWAFTCPGPGPLTGLTFYVPAGSSIEFVARRWSEKKAGAERNEMAKSSGG